MILKTLMYELSSHLGLHKNGLTIDVYEQYFDSKI